MMGKNQSMGAHVIDIGDFGTCTTREINPLIHKIQHNYIHFKDKKAYEPSNISIGPYHHSNPELHAVEKMKWAYLNYVLELNREKKLQDYIEAMSKLEEKARNFYANEFKMDRNRFIEMLLLDGCFILVAFNGIHGIMPDLSTTIEETSRATNENDNGEEKSFEFEQFYTKNLMRDSLLVENQIPFFVVIKIYELLTGGQSQTSLLMKNVFESMTYALDYYPNTIRDSDRTKEVHHLLHLCHMYFKPSIKFVIKNKQKLPLYHEYKSQRAVNPSVFFFRRAMEYREVRIELKKREFCTENPHSLLDIKFINGTLEIPFFNFDWKNFDIFRNLVAFEHTSPHFGNYITAYIVFWSQFISTPDDVAFLVDNGIIIHNLHNDKELCDLFRSLGDNINFDFNGDYYLKSTCSRMEEHYQICRPIWKKWFGSITSEMNSLVRRTKTNVLKSGI